MNTAVKISKAFTIEETIAKDLQSALQVLGLPLPVATIAESLTFPPTKTLGHYAFPCFRYAKQLRLPPAAIATALQQQLPQSKWLYQSKVEGGFLNFFICPVYLATNLLPNIRSGAYFQHTPAQPQTYMLEYSQPNTHKILHVGHIRNICLGDSLCRILRYQGHKVIAANYIGDEGTHVAKCLWHLARSGEETPANNRAEWLGSHYVAATKVFEKDKHQAELSQILRAIAQQRGKFYQLWQQTRAYCLEDFATVYTWLQTKFDVYYYESEVAKQAEEIIKTFIEKKVFTESEGAYGAHLGDLGFFMVLKSDGNTLYATKDLALAYLKYQQHNFDRSLYVVGAEQTHYFTQVFKALALMGFGGAEKNTHISYGLVRLKTGKMSSRQGNIVPFSLLQKQLTTELAPHLQKYQDKWSHAQIHATQHLLASGAIKYGMLQNDPQKEIVFDLPAWLRFDGNTGVYLMYAYARAHSLLEKAGDKVSMEHLQLLTNAEEGDLLLMLCRFNRTVAQAEHNLKPSLLATLLYALAKSFSKFYTEHAILRADSKELIGARLALVKCFCTTYKQGLSLLGITSPTRI